VYLLGHVLHRLDDAHATRVLHACARTMSQDARLLIVERVFPDANAPAADAQFAALSDAVALAVWGGVERTLNEIEALLSGAGLVQERATGTAKGDTLIEGARAR